MRRFHRRMLGPLIAVVLSSPLPAVVHPPAPPPPAAAPATPLASPSTACAKNTGKAITGTVFGQDDRDVNVSLGFDLVDGSGRAVNADPRQPGYGCAKTGGYSIAQTYLNHFVGPEGAPANSLMKDGHRTTRGWQLVDIPSNAVGAYIEVYTRGYQGSPCKDSAGNYCFNPENHVKYGNSNKHLVPIGTANLPIRLPTTCAYGGTAGSITGTVTDSSGRRTNVQSLYAWTEYKWNASPYYQGWGTAQFSSTGAYTVPALASGQTYVMWATTAGGQVVKKSGVRVNSCAATNVAFTV